MATIRVDEKTHKAVSHLLIKRRDNGSPDLTMAALGDEIAIAGLAWFQAGGRVVDGKAIVGDGAPDDMAKAVEDAAPGDTVETVEKAFDADGHLRKALDTETLRLVRERREEVANRARGAEKKTLAATAADMILVAWNRIAAIQKDAAKRKAG